MIKFRVWRWNDYLRYPSGFNIMTEGLLRERGRQEGDREEEVMGSRGQRNANKRSEAKEFEASSTRQKKQENNSPLQSPERIRPCLHLDLRASELQN